MISADGAYIVAFFVRGSCEMCPRERFPINLACVQDSVKSLERLFSPWRRISVPVTNVVQVDVLSVDVIAIDFQLNIGQIPGYLSCWSANRPAVCWSIDAAVAWTSNDFRGG